MAQVWSYTNLGEIHVAPGIGGSLNVNKAILISAVGPGTGVAAGAALDVSDDLEHVAFGSPAGLKAAADAKWVNHCLIAAGNSGADLKILTWDISTSAVAPNATVLSGVEQRMVLYGWD